MTTARNLLSTANSCYDLVNLYKSYPASSNEFIEIILDDPNEFERLIKDSVDLKVLKNIFPKYIDRLTTTVLHDSKKFKRLIKDTDDLIVFFKSGSAIHQDALIKKILNNSDEFRYLFEKNNPDLIDLKNAFPQYTKEINALNDKYMISSEHNISMRPNWVKNKLMNMNDSNFMSHIIKNQAVAQLVVNSAELSNRLDNIPLKTKPGSQGSFKKSCTAVCIMWLLYKFKMIPQLSRTIELDIYSQIWKAPQEITQLSLVKKYLDKHNISMNLMEDFNISNQLKLHPTFLNVYNDEIVKCNLLNNKATNKNAVTPTSKNQYFFIIVYNPKLMLHTLLLSYEKGIYTLTDPADGNKIEDNDMQTILNRMLELGGALQHTGIALQVTKPVKPLNVNGLFNKLTVQNTISANDVQRKKHFAIQ